MKHIIYIMALISISFSYALAEKAGDVVEEFSGDDTEIVRTRVIDSDENGIYDTFIVRWSDEDSESYPICGIGDIRKWPPTGIPRVEITNSSIDDNSFTERYSYDGTTSKVYWFTKHSEIDTVYFRDNVGDQSSSESESYNTNDIENDSKAELRVTPNPAVDIIKLIINAEESGKATISIYNERGIKVDVIMNQDIRKGVNDKLYNAIRLSQGTYFVEFMLNNKLVALEKLQITR